jgi:hypothetical protein
VGSEDEWLHLFSSNIRELYIADTIDLLAAPWGFIYQFRYQEEHVQDEARIRWHSRREGLTGCKVVVYYSLQHAANFHPAAYVPLRYGEVVHASVQGKTYVVQFKLLGYASLADPKEDQRRDKLVQDFSKKIRDQLAPSYPDYADDDGSGLDKRRSATLGPSPANLIDASGDEGAKFERVVRYMSDALGPQQPRLFFRVASIRKSNKANPEKLSNDGYLKVTAGNHYSIEVAHYQMASPGTGSALQISAPKGIDLLTPTELPLRSRYDVMPVQFFAPFRDDEVQGELTMRVKEPAQGASLRIPVSITPSTTHAVFSPMFAILGAFCVVVPATLGQSAPLEPKLWFAAIGAFLVTAGAWTRRSKGLSA